MWLGQSDSASCLVACKVWVTRTDNSRRKMAVVWRIDTKRSYALSVIIWSEHLHSQSKYEFMRAFTIANVNAGQCVQSRH
jgi:hypothetical protein